MHPYPHRYLVTARGGPLGSVPIASAGLPDMHTQPPPEFDGPGGFWSPETLLVAAVADCYVLSFRSVAHFAKFSWEKLECAVEGTLDRSGGTTRFSAFNTRATLTVPAGADVSKAQELLLRAEKVCLVSNSLLGERHLETTILETPS